jgi:peroxiredoxin Q/BCP
MRWCQSGSFVTLVVAAVLGCGRRDESKPSEAAAASAGTRPSNAALRAASKLLEVGEVAPRFTGLAHTGMRFELGQFLVRHPVLVHFCVGTNAAECDRAEAAVRDDWFHLRAELGMAIFVFADDEIKLRERAYEREDPFLLVSDVEGTVARAFGVGVSTPAAPIAFLIGKDGKIMARFPEARQSYLDDVKRALSASPPGSSPMPLPSSSTGAR